jgi:hypothetical protein
VVSEIDGRMFTIGDGPRTPCVGPGDELRFVTGPLLRDLPM